MITKSISTTVGLGDEASLDWDTAHVYCRVHGGRLGYSADRVRSCYASFGEETVFWEDGFGRGLMDG